MISIFVKGPKRSSLGTAQKKMSDSAKWMMQDVKFGLEPEIGGVRVPTARSGILFTLFLQVYLTLLNNKSHPHL